ncbi:MAG: hypothetical protein QF632_00200 [Candidatus Woesearchaeota archaeon]|jgi:hypothetical protein|nr:hypothetical protein [Candidatus Woesearchaeota archaeon]MDP7457426.1 hypothetical protein [Candidatus Woesearchaeota archaeon]|tara:strand:+ start:250 stop:834 length:585 start_codon:yes stop_codon:yes gene_type:complete
MGKTLDEIKKLHPEERIKRLKELEEERKEEIQEAESMIRDSKQEIQDDLIEKMKVPEQEPVEVEQLFHQKEEVVEDKPVRVEQNWQLEDTVEQTEIKAPEQEIAEQASYDISKIEEALSGKSKEDLYGAVADLMNKPAEKMSSYEKNKVEAVYNLASEHEQKYAGGQADQQKVHNPSSKIMGLHQRIQDELYHN